MSVVCCYIRKLILFNFEVTKITDIQIIMKIYRKLLSVFKFIDGHDWAGRQAYLGRQSV